MNNNLPYCNNIIKTLIVLFIVFLCINFETYAQSKAITGPHIIVYKTKKNYNNLVPIIFNDDRTTIISYPDPLDIKPGNSQPIAMHKKYLLDRRGIDKNVAFLNKTYEEYANLSQVPSKDDLLQMIKTEHPLVVLCDCGPRQNFKNVEQEINEWIDKGILKEKCKVMFNY